MAVKRRFFTGLISIIVIVLVWYLFVKDYNYKVTFETPHAPGTVYSSLYNVDKWKPVDVDSVEIVDSKPYHSITYNIFTGDSLLQVEWLIKRLNDSMSGVTALSKDINNGLKQNLLVPFQENDFVKRSIKISKGLLLGLDLHQKEYKVEVIRTEPVKVQSQYCAYIPLKSRIYEKGNAMISNIGLVMNYIKANEISLTGDPFLQVTSWNTKEEIIEYDFCFPINKLDSMPPTNTIKFKNTQEFNALKAIFNGNYRLSDRAWYELADHAERQGIRVKMNPFEVYRNDPHSGGNELEWIAEVYLPIQE